MDDAWPIERQTRPARARLRVLLGGGAAPGEVDRLLARIRELEARVAAAAEPPGGYLLFVVSPAGFSIVECDEEPPPEDQLLLLDDGVYRIASVRRSPFPNDARPCLVVERTQPAR